MERRPASTSKAVGLLVLVAASLLSGASLVQGRGEQLGRVPPVYQGKHMPAGWWTDPTVIAEGKRLYEGTAVEAAHVGVICAVCHGEDGKPLQRGVRDLSRASYMAQMTEDYWYWRVAEGAPRTKMMGWKDALTEAQIWKVIAYEHTFSHGGKAELHNH